MRPRLVAVAHGTRNPAGPHTIDLVMRQVRRRLPNVEVTTAFVELNEPSLSSVMSAADGPAVVVPLLLSTGYHVNHDLPQSAKLSAHPVSITRPLGPHPLLAAVMGLRLRAAGARRGDPVVMVAAGSTDSEALVDTHVAGRMLQAHWGAPVQVAHLTGAGQTLPEAVEVLRDKGHKRVAVAPYLIAPGFFANKAHALAHVHGAAVVADLLGSHALLAELVIRRYASAVRVSPGDSPGVDGFVGVRARGVNVPARRISRVA